MKPTLFIVIVSSIVISVFTGISEEPYKLPEPITQEHNHIHVGVIPQVELISIVQMISTYPTVFDFLMTQDTSKYTIDVLRHFGEYKDHPAVLMFDRLSLQPRMLNFSAPSNVMLYTDEYLNIRTDIHPDDFVLNRAGGLDSLNVFLTLLKDFAEVSSFNKFYGDQKEYYNKIIEHTTQYLGTTDYINELELFYGVKQRSYNICLVSLYNHVGFGNSLLHRENQREISNTMGPQRMENDIPFFGDERYLKYMIRHEFSHPFVNPLTEKYRDYIVNYSHKFEEIPEIARKNVCGEWEECINEFIVRAATVHIAYLESEEAGLQAYEVEKSRGVNLLDPLLSALNVYADNRLEYPTFESFYPNILDVFKD